MTEKEAQELLNRYLTGRSSDDEKALVERWYLNMTSHSNLPAQSDLSAVKSEMWQAICMNNNPQPASKWPVILAKGSAAAAIILICALVWYSTKPNPTDTYKTQLIETQPTQIKQRPDVMPAENKAILTLADGSRVVLDDAGRGLIASDAGISISKTDDGSIKYEIVANTRNHNPGNHTIETPKGGKFQVVLPDGTKVWLNAASRLRFPTAFDKKERKIHLDGEAYFEVAADKMHPFIVSTSDMDVRVTGTRFNVMAYHDENYNATTLLEGVVEVRSEAKRMTLTPGEQAIMHADLSIKRKDADVSEAIAWKNGLFQFDNADIYAVMRQISRWYAVEVLFSDKVSATKFSGFISRDSKLSQVLKMLELSGLKFKLNDNKINVLP